MPFSRIIKGLEAWAPACRSSLRVDKMLPHPSCHRVLPHVRHRGSYSCAHRTGKQAWGVKRWGQEVARVESGFGGYVPSLPSIPPHLPPTQCVGFWNGTGHSTDQSMDQRACTVDWVLSWPLWAALGWKDPPLGLERLESWSPTKLRALEGGHPCSPSPGQGLALGRSSRHVC